MQLTLKRLVRRCKREGGLPGRNHQKFIGKEQSGSAFNFVLCYRVNGPTAVVQIADGAAHLLQADKLIGDFFCRCQSAVRKRR